jgi:hypothetical protein
LRIAALGLEALALELGRTARRLGRVELAHAAQPLDYGDEIETLDQLHQLDDVAAAAAAGAQPMIGPDLELGGARLVGMLAADRAATDPVIAVLAQRYLLARIGVARIACS